MNKRRTYSYEFKQEELDSLKTKMLNWLEQFSIFVYLDNNQYNHEPNRFELLVGANSVRSFNDFPEMSSDWLFGHVSYDYKNELFPKLASCSKHENKATENILFFTPEIVIYIPFGKNKLFIECLKSDPEKILSDIISSENVISKEIPLTSEWTFSITKEEYLQKIKSIQQDIKEGDFYELNYCVQAKRRAEKLNAVSIFHQLNTKNPSPFAAFYQNENTLLMCASPERFIYTKEGKITAQPIKGTIVRKLNFLEDQKQKESLFKDEKERAENVMIVDLMRNDLAQCSEVGSVKVPELFGVYTFPQLHHLISTIEAQLLPGVSLADIFKVTFPMGSMTGAPKYTVMQKIAKYENFRRGIFSGTVGYIMPNGDFDFNVIIRSLIWNKQTEILSYYTGGAITYDSIPEKEWDEVLLKAKAIKQLFSDTSL